MSKPTKVIQSNFCKSLRQIAKELDKDPSLVTRAEFFEHDFLSIPEWDIRKLGGFAAMKNMYFPPTDINLAEKQGSSLIRSHRSKLEKEYGNRAFIQDELISGIAELLTKHPVRMHSPVKGKSKKSIKAKTRTILAHLSDTHYGTNIDSKELGGLNHYNWTIAARRTALFMEQIANYKLQYRNETDLVLVVNGDLIGGLIHNQEFVVDLWTLQFAGTVDIMTQAISYLATKFSKVTVEWTTGNHGRVMHKADKGRATTQKWDSFETTIGLAVKLAIERTHKNVKINIPTTPYNIINVQGHLIFATHGDTVFSTGNVGSSINMRSINTQIAKLNSSELGGSGKKFAAVMAGHVHTPMVQLTESGCMLIVNGCLSGTDGYAQSLGIFESNPTQQIIEVTQDYVVGDMRFIQVKSGDKETKYDEIIKPFKGSLE